MEVTGGYLGLKATGGWRLLEGGGYWGMEATGGLENTVGWRLHQITWLLESPWKGKLPKVMIS